MDCDARLQNERFPRSLRYHPAWVIRNGMGSNPLWMAEWLASVMDFQSGMRVLDLGCGRAISSIFLAREFQVQVWATDLWISASENEERIRDAGLQDQVFPLHADARSLPYAGEFFDAIVCLDSLPYYGTDALYLNYLAHFVKPGGQIGVAGAGLVKEFDEGVPVHLRSFWTQDVWALSSANWWKHQWGRTGIVAIEVADTMPEGWQLWRDWHRTLHPQGSPEIEAVEADRGGYLGYIRMVGRRRPGVKLEDYCWPDTMRSLPMDYDKKPLLREVLTS